MAGVIVTPSLFLGSGGAGSVLISTCSFLMRPSIDLMDMFFPAIMSSSEAGVVSDFCCCVSSVFSWSLCFLDEATLWRTYTMLTELEAVFRSLKSELGMRPVFHQITKRVTGHLFISVLAYHLLHSIRYRLKKVEINSSWSNLRKQPAGQNRVTISMQCKNDEVLHVRKSTQPEPRQQKIYSALELFFLPGKTTKTIINKINKCSAIKKNLKE